MNWWPVLLAAAVAALFEFSLPIVAVLLGLYGVWLVVQRLRTRRELRYRRALVAFAVETARADVAGLERRIPGEQTTVVLVPQQRPPS